MNLHERMRHELMMTCATKLPNLSKDELCAIAQSFDNIAAHYNISEAETRIAVLGREEFIRVIKCFIVVKKMEGISDNTISRYLLVLKNFMESMTKPLGEITANDIRLFLFKYQNERDISNRTLECMRVVIGTFMRWATSEGYIERDPSASLRPIKYTNKPREALEQIELEKLRNACRDIREKALLEVMYSTGCRVSELCGIKVGDINWENKTVTLLGKGNKYRTSYINAKAELSMRAYLKWRKHDSQYLFCNDRGGSQMKKDNIERIVRNLRDRAGITDKKVTPHVLRHTTATQALHSGMPINDIQALLGHSNVSTTMIYAHVSQSDVQAGHKRCIV